MKMRKIVAVLMTVLMLCCIIPFSAMADTTATIDFTDKANRTAYSTEQQVWEQNGITITNDKGDSTSNVGDYGGDGYPARFYKNSTVKIEYPGMTSIVIECKDLESKYVNGWADSATGATATVEGGYVTIVFASAVDSFVWAPMTAQSRAYSIAVFTNGSAPVIPNEPETPDEPVTEDPEADTELSIADAIALGLSKAHNTYTEGKYFVTGTITEVYNEVYGNMYITDAAGNVLTIYGTYDADGTNRYDAMEVKPVAGDVVTIYGIVGQYKDVAQIKNGWVVKINEPGSEPDDVLTIEEAIALGQTMEHNTFTEEKYNVTGVITEVYNTQYGNMKLTDAAGNILTIYGSYNADGTVRYDAMDVQPVAGDTVTIYGIVGQYNGTSQIKNGWIVAHTAAGGETPDEPSEPDTPDEPSEPEVPAVSVVTKPEAGVAYKFALEQTQKGALYYFTGAMSGYYGATETDINLAVDMYVEIVDGGYKLYFTVDGAKQYIKLEQSGTHYNFTFGAEGSVFTLDAEKNAFCAPAGDQICYMGTYGSYVTVGCLTSEKISDSDYVARLYAVNAETPDEPSEPETPDEPGTDSPVTGDTTVYATLAVILVALSAAALVVTKKRA